MHSYELLREVFEKKAPKQVAADLGLSLSMVYKWAEPPNHASGSGTGNPLDRIEGCWAAPATSGWSNGFASAPAAFSFKTRSTRRIRIS